MIVGASLLVALGAAIASLGEAFVVPGRTDQHSSFIAYGFAALAGMTIVAVGLWLGLASAPSLAP